ncbi:MULTISPECIES: hypothetical protein [Bacillus amyloliquefaciens group]|uniref:hypothetical protein n=1 Tax=Bacillus amyloliquefaciens group TaxID=1938374 RepID=UPI00266FD385|nr:MULTISPECIES: hypothetical protein [Bacillus amyloliquefaciens group]MEC1940365.1 hypothetical protein [Bacillus velezensis]MED4523608.1 hypothetical protein [Bacillus velezensis]WKT37450.1 hypothetical protein Q2B68_07240 [Bacillus amyloliquefaciens]WKT37541.1 hypothetical protein Q2B68_07710 [Bacillus amyloliquefaciens]
MFKRRLIETLMFLLLGIFMGWALTFPVARAIFTIAAVFGLLLVGLYGIVRFILWLIVEPYRAHKREKARSAE